MSKPFEVDSAEVKLEDAVFDVRVMKETTDFPPGCLRQGLIDTVGLTANCEAMLGFELHDVHPGRPQLMRDNPYLDEQQRERLDEDGLIRVGSRVSEGDVLASIVRPNSVQKDGKRQIHDSSWCVPLGWDNSEVIAVRRESSTGRRREFPRGVLERLAVRLRRTIPFFLSDSLGLGGHVVSTTRLIENRCMPVDANGQQADLVIPNSIADVQQLSDGEIRSVRVSRISPSAIDVVKARSTGPYSLITMTPLGKYTRRSGTMVTDEHFRWLQERGLFSLLSEFVSLKCDDLQNRSILRAMAKGHGDATAITAAAPESFFEMQQLLWSMGLAVQARSDKQCVAVALRPASDHEVVRRSSGVIGRPETLNYRTYLPVEGGLFCETVFGPEGSPSRRRNSGHIELCAPIIPILWRLGPNPVLAGVLGLDPTSLDSLILRKTVVHERQGSYEFRELSDVQDESLLSAGWTFLGTGYEAVQALMERADPRQIPSVFGSAGEMFFTRMIPVLPPDLRPLVLLDDGNFATADVNDLYRQVINRNNRLRKLKELNAPPIIIHNEISSLQTVVDRLHANMWLPKRQQEMGSGGRPLVCLFASLTGRIAEIGKRVEWVGQARAVANSGLDSRRVDVPEEIFDELRLRADGPILLTSSFKKFVARLPNRIDGPLIRLNGADATTLLDEESVVAIHRPLTTGAFSEAKRLLDQGEESVPPEDRTPSDDWCQDSDPTQILDSLIDAALTGASVKMNSPRGIALFGTGAMTSQFETEPVEQTTHWIDVPAKTPKPLPSMDEMAEVIRAHRRRSCLFRATRCSGELLPKAGRIGGLPWMPPGFRWPLKRTGEPMEFVGQFPLDQARQANLLPFDVPPGSILTVFWNGELDNAGSSLDGALTIHSTEELFELQPPEDDYWPTPLCSIAVEIGEMYPCPSKALEILDWELDLPNPGQLSKFKADYEKLFSNPTEISRIGGYPSWIQNPESIQFVAQVCSGDAVTELNFGDGGSLYIHGDAPNALSAIGQCY